MPSNLTMSIGWPIGQQFAHAPPRNPRRVRRRPRGSARAHGRNSRNCRHANKMAREAGFLDQREHALAVGVPADARSAATTSVLPAHGQSAPSDRCAASTRGDPVQRPRQLSEMPLDGRPAIRRAVEIDGKDAERRRRSPPPSARWPGLARDRSMPPLLADDQLQP